VVCIDSPQHCFISLSLVLSREAPMKPKTIVILGGVFLGFVCLTSCCLVASYLTSQLIAQKNARILLVVARHNYPSGTAINDPEEMFEIREFPASEAPAGCVTDLEDLRDRTLIKDIREGEPVLTFFLERSQEALKSMLINEPEPGKRAIEVKTLARGGFIKPGSRVDVIYSKSDGDVKAEAKTLLQNVLVRAVERQMPDRGHNGGFVSLIVTLDVTPEEALVLAPLKEKGSITLIIRPKDRKESDANKATKRP
jgi:Flp pilus assembly protein CpaB